MCVGYDRALRSCTPSHKRAGPVAHSFPVLKNAPVAAPPGRGVSSRCRTRTNDYDSVGRRRRGQTSHLFEWIFGARLRLNSGRACIRCSQLVSFGGRHKTLRMYVYRLFFVLEWRYLFVVLYLECVSMAMWALHDFTDIILSEWSQWHTRVVSHWCAF